MKTSKLIKRLLDSIVENGDKEIKFIFRTGIETEEHCFLAITNNKEKNATNIEMHKMCNYR